MMNKPILSGIVGGLTISIFVLCSSLFAAWMDNMRHANATEPSRPSAPTLDWRNDSPSIISMCSKDMFKDLPALAERLGVKEGQGTGSFVLGMCDGRKYDFFAMINAVLDRLDAATKVKDQTQVPKGKP